MKKSCSKKQAFTIVELIIVIAVIGVLAAILIPAFTNIIAKANAKSALSDARNSLLLFTAENLEITDGQIATSIVIFVEKAKQYYIYGCDNQGDDAGVLEQSAGNPYDYQDFTELVIDYNCPSKDILGTEEESNYAVYLRTEPSGSGLKGKLSMEEINNRFINLSNKMANSKFPKTVKVFDGFLIGKILDATSAQTVGTKPGEKPGGQPGDSGTTLPNYSLNFDADGGTLSLPAGFSNGQKFKGGENVAEIVAEATATKDNFTFMGWTDGEITYGSEYSGAIQISKDITLTAVWEESKYSITYAPDNGEDNFDGGSYSQGEEVILADAPARDGYHFNGWYCSVKNMTFGAGGSYEMPNQNITLGAIWFEKYEISFVNNDGIGEVPSMTMHYAGYELTLPAALSKEGYTFKGWLCSHDSIVYDEGDTYIVEADAIFTATFAFNGPVDYEIEFSIFDVFNEQHSTIKATVSLMSGESITINDGNFSDYFGDCKPNTTFSQTFTASGSTITPAQQNVDVIRFVIIDSKEFIKVTTLTGLNKIDDSAANMSKNYLMQNDITSVGDFTPLGWVGNSSSNKIPFTGIFDGNHYTISNFKADFGANSANQQNYVGLFAHNSGTIKNLELICSDSIFGLTYVGGIAGKNDGTISSCVVINDGNTVGAQQNNGQAGNGFSGGMTGYNSATGKILNCTSDVSQVFAYSRSGGIAGMNLGQISDCEALGGVNSEYSLDATVSAPKNNISLYYVGGIAGSNSGTISNCEVPVHKNAISGTRWVGGVAGMNSPNATIENCVITIKNDKEITGRSMVGGAVGLNDQGTITTTHVAMNSSLERIVAVSSTTKTIGGVSGTGVYLGGVAGANDSGTISKSSYCALNGGDIYVDNTGGTDKQYYYVGGITGRNSGTISETWTYRPYLNTETYLSLGDSNFNVANAGCLQEVAELQDKMQAAEA